MSSLTYCKTQGWRLQRRFALCTACSSGAGLTACLYTQEEVDKSLITSRWPGGCSCAGCSCLFSLVWVLRGSAASLGGQWPAAADFLQEESLL